MNNDILKKIIFSNRPKEENWNADNNKFVYNLPIDKERLYQIIITNII